MWYLAEYTCQDEGHKPARFADLDEAGRKEYWATLALRHCAGIGARSLARLLKQFGSALEAIHSIKNWPENKIAKASCDYFENGNWREDAKKEWDSAKGSDALILLWASNKYPDSLRELADAPALLYCRGKLSLLEAPCVALVGTRNPSAAGCRIATNLAESLSDSGVTVVSGMALGIDREAHAGALSGDGKSIGVLGTGIDVLYPKTNKDIFSAMQQEGLLVSEFAPRTSPIGRNFPIRNRIISGLSLGVVVIEAAARSGSLITARLALEQNREIFAVPDSPYENRSPGCHNLIREGARPVINAEEIIRDLAPALKSFDIPEKPPIRKATRQGSLLPPPSPEKKLTPEVEAVTKKALADTDHERILNVLAHETALHADALLDKTGIDASRLNAALVLLEMTGEIERLPGSRYRVAS